MLATRLFAKQPGSLAASCHPISPARPASGWPSPGASAGARAVLAGWRGKASLRHGSSQSMFLVQEKQETTLIMNPGFCLPPKPGCSPLQGKWDQWTLRSGGGVAGGWAKGQGPVQESARPSRMFHATERDVKVG